MCNLGEDNDFMQTFLGRYRTEFGFTLAGREVLVDDVRVRGTGQSGIQLEELAERAVGDPVVEKTTQVQINRLLSWRNIPYKRI